MNRSKQNPFRTKICGITRQQDFSAAVEAGTEAIGLNFYQQGKRYVDPNVAEKFIAAHESDNATHGSASTSLPHLIGVFVNESVDRIVEIAQQLSLTGVQFHGDETPDMIAQLRNKLTNDCLLIRAVRTKAESETISATQTQIDTWCEAGVDVILLDASAPNAYGGTGTQLNWNNVDRLSIPVPWILAGGLKPDNVASAIDIANPQGVDTASGVEVSPGIKDSTLVRAFIANSNQAFG